MDGLRSIPASAGQPGDRVLRYGFYSVYPRECGATGTCCPHPAQKSGLSPRVRGNHSYDHGRTVIRRSIPASAGQPRPLPAPSTVSRVYPRECGATPSNSSSGRSQPGLSPRVRGNHFYYFLSPLPLGSIPASAGQPCLARRSAVGPWVYPRECGATMVKDSMVTSLLGLSPRVRGNP